MCKRDIINVERYVNIKLCDIRLSSCFTLFFQTFMRVYVIPLFVISSCADLCIYRHLFMLSCRFYIRWCLLHNSKHSCRLLSVWFPKNIPAIGRAAIFGRWGKAKLFFFIEFMYFPVRHVKIYRPFLHLADQEEKKSLN